MNQEYLSGTQVADADYRTKQFYAVIVSATGIVLCGAGLAADGILHNDPNITENCKVCYIGQTKAVAGAAFARGVELMVDANGKLITATTGKKIVAKAMAAATADGDIVQVLFYKNGEVA